MWSCFFWLAVLAITASAQFAVDPARLPAHLREFKPPPDGRIVGCQATPIKPRIDFGFRFQAGYFTTLPLQHYSGSKHSLAILTRVTPAGGQPVYLLSTINLPAVPKTKAVIEIGGSYQLGEGDYSVDWMLLDDANRVCTKHWNVKAHRSRAERNVNLRLAAGTVRSLYSRLPRASSNPEPNREPIGRITILLHAAPLFSRSTQLRAFDREFLLGSLSSLLEELAASSIRLVAFNLDQQKKLFSSESFNSREIVTLGQRLRELQLGTIDYKILQNGAGHLNLIDELLADELKAKDRAEAIIFLGPAARFFQKYPKPDFEQEPEPRPGFFYIQCRPFTRGGPEYPDLIQSLMKKINGKTFNIHSPGEFADALKQIRKGLPVHTASTTP